MGQCFARESSLCRDSECPKQHIWPSVYSLVLKTDAFLGGICVQYQGSLRGNIELEGWFVLTYPEAGISIHCDITKGYLVERGSG